MFRVLLAAAFVVALTPAPAHADTLTWTVQPATQAGPDGRRWIERTVDPGQTVTEHLAVRNFSGAAARFALKAADGYLTDKGRFNMLASDQRSKDGGTWIAVQPTVDVPANGTTVVPFTITVPKAATPGDHPAGIAATIVSGNGTVAVESRVGFRVMLRAGGTVTPALSASSLTVRYQRSWNPFRSGTVHVNFEAANTGNVRVEPRTSLTVSTWAGSRSKTLDDGELLPGGGRESRGTAGGVWGVGPLRTKVTLIPATVGDPGTLGAPATVSVTTWVLPWPQLGLLVAVAVSVLLLVYRRRRFRRLIERAREEGRTNST